MILYLMKVDPKNIKMIRKIQEFVIICRYSEHLHSKLLMIIFKAVTNMYVDGTVGTCLSHVQMSHVQMSKVRALSSSIDTFNTIIILFVSYNF